MSKSGFRPLATSGLGVNATLRGHRTLPATDIWLERRQNPAAAKTLLQVNWCYREAEMLCLFTKLQIYVKKPITLNA